MADRFRIAILGDFTGRSARGQIEVGASVAGRRAIPLDVDTIEDVIRGFATTLVLPIGKDGAGVEVRLNELDDLHPDELFEKVELFEGLSSLKRQLGAGATAEHAANQLKDWGQAFGQSTQAPRRSSSGSSVRTGVNLSEFQKLIGDTGAQLAQASQVDELLKRVVGPHIRQLPDPDVSAMNAAIDEAIGSAMRLVLHHPEFQAIESQWRSLDLIARHVEDDVSLDVTLFDISADEIAVDLATTDILSETGLAQLLNLRAEGDPRGGFSAIVGLYTFEETPTHANILARIARVAAHAGAPFLSAISPAFLETAEAEREPAVAQAWQALRAMPEASYLGLASPRFLLRRPYGAKSEPVYEFEFEEFTEAEGLSGMLWANPATLVAILLARSFKRNGLQMNLGSVMSLGDMPYHIVRDRFGDQVALPCTERNMTLAKHEQAIQRGYMPVISVKGRDEIRLGSFNSVAGPEIRGPWSDATAPAAPSNIPTLEMRFAFGTANTDGDAVLTTNVAADRQDDDGDEDMKSKEMDPELAALLADL